MNAVTGRIKIAVRVDNAVKLEMVRQKTLWGVQDHPANMWLPILVEEVGEVAQDVNGLLFSVTSVEEQEAVDNHLYEELTHVAAVAMSWLENIERRRLARDD